MPRIHLLSEELANRIAAGEVVERPASVVKELVENAIDAGARRIEVEIAEGGRRLIRVADDGCGMAAEDAVLAIQRFATSKVQRAEDLDAILTMGFRGEALPSIAAVSHLRLQTREPEATEGCQVAVHGGGAPEVRPVGCPAGTVVEVTDLFYNTPARLKFLGTSARERGHCHDWVQRLALAHPRVAFKLTHDRETIFMAPGTGDLRSVLAAVYGGKDAREFLDAEWEEGGVRVAGLVSGPKVMRATREHQLFFVNQRFVRSRQMGHALNEAYGLLLPAGRNAVCALHVTLEPERVDPNVHPTKIEVRFRQGGAVHDLVQRATEEALARAGFRSLTQSPRHVPRPEERSGPFPAGRVPPPGFDDKRRAARLRVNPFQDRVDERDEGLEVFSQPTAGRVSRLSVPQPGAPPALTPEATPGPVEVLGQVGSRYLVAREPGGLLLIDQHRAAERVLLERLQPRRLARQLLITGETVHLTPGEAAAARDNLALLAELGYELEEFGGTDFLVRSVPAEAAALQPLEVLRQVVADLAEFGAPTTAEQRSEQARASLACHAAAKKGQHMNPAEMQGLVDELMDSQSPAVCPHGDPIIVSFALERLDREFRR